MTPEEIKQAIDKLSNLVNTSQFTEAKNLAYELLELKEVQENSELVCNVYRDLGLITWRQSDFENALIFFEKALNINEEIGNKKDYGGNLVNIGLVYSNLSEYKKALEYFEKAIFILEEINYKPFLSNAFMNVGNVYLAIANYSKALEYYKKSLDINKDIGNQIGLANNFANIGIVYYRQSEYPKAFENTFLALQINEEIGNNVGISNNYGNLGVFYINQKEYDKSYEFLKKAIIINEEIENIYSKTANLISIAAIYANDESNVYDISKSEEYLNNSIKLSMEIGAKDLLMESYEVLYQLRLKERRFEEALEYKLKSITIEKEINTNEVKNQAERLEILLKTAERNKQLAVERAEAETIKQILHNVLPIKIANRIIKQETFIADYFQSVSVLFMDLVGFTSLASNAPPKHLVYLLDSIFQKADEVVETFGLEKIKTIGDGYLAVANVTSPLEEHQKATALAALQLLETMREFTVNIPSDLGETDWIKDMKDLEIRIGIHTGEVVAGIIGKNKYTFDLWGDAVNVASRMESNSEAGKIHISEEFAKSIEQNSEFSIIPRGEINIKGKGTMKTFWLEKGK